MELNSDVGYEPNQEELVIYLQEIPIITEMLLPFAEDAEASVLLRSVAKHVVNQAAELDSNDEQGDINILLPKTDMDNFLNQMKPISSHYLADLKLFESLLPPKEINDNHRFGKESLTLEDQFSLESNKPDLIQEKIEHTEQLAKDFASPDDIRTTYVIPNQTTDKIEIHGS